MCRIRPRTTLTDHWTVPLPAGQLSACSRRPWSTHESGHCPASSFHWRCQTRPWNRPSYVWNNLSNRLFASAILWCNLQCMQIKYVRLMHRKTSVTRFLCFFSQMKRCRPLLARILRKYSETEKQVSKSMSPNLQPICSSLQNQATVFCFTFKKAGTRRSKLKTSIQSIWHSCHRLWKDSSVVSCSWSYFSSV